MFKFTIKIATLTLCLLLSAYVVNAQVKNQTDSQIDEHGWWINGIAEPWLFEHGDKYTSEEAATARKLWNDLAKDEAGGEWAGVYVGSEGDLNMTYTRWSPKHGFVHFSIYTCQPSVRGIDFGKVVVTDDHVQFISSRQNQAVNKASSSESEPESENEPDKYIKAKWGERHLLVRENDIEYFFNFTSGRGDIQTVDGMSEPNFLMKDKDWEKPNADVPIVPAAYAEYVKKPYDARIIKIGKSYEEYDPEDEYWFEVVTPVTLDAGNNRGLKRGMVLYIVKSKENETVELTRVGKTFARGIIVRRIKKSDAPPTEYSLPQAVYPVIEAGWQVSTSSHKK